MSVKKIIMILLLVPVFTGALYWNPYYKQEVFKKDLAVLQKVLERKPGNPAVMRRIITLSFVLEDFETCAAMGKKYLVSHRDRRAEWKYIIALSCLGKNQDAVKAVDRYIARYRPSGETKKLIEEKRKAFQKKGVPAGMPSLYNEKGLHRDFTVLSYLDREGLFFIENNLTGLRSFMSFEKGNIIEAPAPDYLKNIDLSPCTYISISPDGREVLLSMSYGSGKSDLLYKFYDPVRNSWRGWSRPRGLNPGTWNGSGNIFPRGALFVSRKERGNYDIYFSQRSGNTFYNAVPVKNINTSLDELSVFLHRDGKTCYFTSNGFPGMGGYDIFGTVLSFNENEASAGKIIPVDEVNTYRDEYCPLFVPPSAGKFYSTFKKADITGFFTGRLKSLKPKPVFICEGYVYKDRKKSPLRHRAVKLSSQKGRHAVTALTGKDGFYNIVLPLKGAFGIKIDTEEKRPYRADIALQGEGPVLRHDVVLDSYSGTGGGIRVLLLGLKADKMSRKVKKTLYSEIGEGLKGVGGLYVIPERDSGKILGKDAAQYSCKKAECALSAGKMTAAEKVVYGKVRYSKEKLYRALGRKGKEQYILQRKFSLVYWVSLKIIDVKSGEVLVSFDEKFTAGKIKRADKTFQEKFSAYFRMNSSISE